MRILIVDDSLLWLRQGKALLEPAGHEVASVHITDPHQYIAESLSGEMAAALEGADVLLIDKDLGAGITSTRLICVVRHNFPKLPVIRWTGGYDDKPYMGFLGVTTIGKPTRREESKFIESFSEAFDKQKLILSGPMGIFAALEETTKPSKYDAEEREHRLEQLAQIAELAAKDRVDSGNWQYPWTITGQAGGVTKHELGHCICDGRLTAEDIRPHLADLQKVVAKFEAAGEIDDRFQICAEFIKAGNLDELELIHRCY